MITIPDDELIENEDVGDSLIDDVLVEESVEESVEMMVEEPIVESVDEIIVPLDEEELIPIGEEPIVPVEDNIDEFVDDSNEDVTASGMNQEATMRIHQLMRTTGQAVANVVRQVTEEDNKSLVETEFEVQQAKISLQDQRVLTANKSLNVAEKNLTDIEEDVQRLRRSIALLHRLLRDPEILRGELEKILMVLKR